VNSTNHRWQYTMTKVGKSDREGTFAGTAGNDGDAPIPGVRDRQVAGAAGASMRRVVRFATGDSGGGGAP